MRFGPKNLARVLAGTPEELELIEACRNDAQRTVDAVEASDQIVSTTFHKIVLAFLRSPQFEAIVRGICTDTARDMAAEHIAERVPELEQRIRTIVAERFDAAVEAVVRTELDAAVADVKRRLVK